MIHGLHLLCDLLMFTDLMIDWVPCHTVDSPHMPSQHSDGLILLDMVDVDLVILGAGGNKGLVCSTKTTVNGVKALKRS